MKPKKTLANLLNPVESLKLATYKILDTDLIKNLNSQQVWF